jgi:hypothetical protein
MRIVFTAALFAVTATASVASAKNYPSTTGQVQVDLPDDWPATGKKDVLFATDKNKELGVIFMVTPKEDTKKSLAALEALLGKEIKDEKWQAPQKIALNGLDGIAMEGTAVIKGHPSTMTVMVLATPNKHNVVMFGAVDADKEAAHQKEIAAILQSIKPLK